MISKSVLLIAAIVIAVIATSTYNVGEITAQASKDKEYTDSFNLDDCTFSSSGSNDYFVLIPGFRLVLEDPKEGVLLVITVLDETRTIDGIQTRIVEERESVDGSLVEISRNYFAICTQTSDVFYFGEGVDIYQDGQVISHDGAWTHGENGARAGLMMPGSPQVGLRYYQEVAPDVALDRAEIQSVDDKVKTPAGVFDDVLKIKETTQLEPLSRDYKYYAPNIGLVKSNTLKLVEFGYV